MVRLIKRIKQVLCTLFLVLVATLSSFSQGSGNALDFDGSTDYIDCGNAASVNITGSITLECWANVDDLSNVMFFVGKHCTHNNRSYDIFYNDGSGNLQFDVIDDANNLYPLTYGGLTTGQWVHMAGTYNQTSGDMVFYIDGEQVATANIGTITIMTSNIATTIGGYWGGVSCNTNRGFVDGEMDEVRIWNVARTQTQIQDNMCKTLQGNETGLVGYWRMNEGSGTTVFDQTANNNDGTLN